MRTRPASLSVFRLALVTAALLAGCSHPGHNTPDATVPPAGLTGDLARADVVVVTNFFSHAGFPLSGEELKRVVRGISSAKRTGRTRSIFAEHLLFFSQSNLLAAVRFQGAHILLEPGEEYLDSTGTLERIGDRMLRRESRATSEIPPRQPGGEMTYEELVAAVKPVRTYQDRGNTVLVQQAKDGEESGKRIPGRDCLLLHNLGDDPSAVTPWSDPRLVERLKELHKLKHVEFP
jgi:hypothetical protein